MANMNVQNILVGVGKVFARVPTTAEKTTPLTGWDADDNIGFTTEGVELAFEPDYGDVMVDQLKDSAKMFNQSLQVFLRTNMAEATLENLAVAWGFGTVDAAGNSVISTSGTGATSKKHFKLGLPLDEPTERQVKVEGKAPGLQADGRPVLREYVGRRAVSVEGATFGLRKTEATVFPVSFRLLPDPSVGTSGGEYGEIVDHIGTAAA